MADIESHGLGWRPDLPDQRDHRLNTFTVPRVPRAFDRRNNLPPVWDQGQIGSCTGHGAAAAWVDAAQHAGAAGVPTPSRLFLYWNARALEGSTGFDAGATIRDVVKGLAKFGAPPEEDWPYLPEQVLTAPSGTAYSHGLQRQALTYARVPHTKAAVSTVIYGGLGVVFGFTVYDSFRGIGSDGIMPMPGRAETVLGGHCVYAVGYNPDYLICRNSWGPGWGKAGHFSMPWGFFLSSNASDAWVISTVEALPFTVTDPRA